MSRRDRQQTAALIEQHRPKSVAVTTSRRAPTPHSQPHQEQQQLSRLQAAPPSTPTQSLPTTRTLPMSHEFAALRLQEALIRRIGVEALSLENTRACVQAAAQLLDLVRRS
ncbi:hypothetical protein [Deinococcus ruber]|uniref:hypothetical protein n=1 Tax=Deinococcus ruber TaxID=1848197 RepID=UPI0016650DE9|nr:hypothetical protein [Deinococcus ruber]